MTDEWYYMSGEQRCGPLDGSTMQQLLSAGVIQPDTNVAMAGASGWIPARDANGFQSLPTVPKASSSTPAIVATLLWGFVPLITFFVSGVLAWKMICDSRYHIGVNGEQKLSGELIVVIHALSPKTYFDPPPEWKHALMLLGIALLPGLLFSLLPSQNPAGRSHKGVVPKWRAALNIVFWFVVVGVCIGVGFLSQTARASVLLWTLKLHGVVLALPLILSSVCMIGIVIVALYGIRHCRYQSKVRNGLHPGLTWATSLTSVWTRTVLILSLMTLVSTMWVWVGVRKKGNPDAIAADSLIQEMVEYRQKVGDDKFVESQNWEIRTIDSWNSHPFHFAIDGDNDGMVTLGQRDIPGKIAVWSDGWNGIDEYGLGDDLIRVAR